MATVINKVPFFMHDLGKAELDSIAEVLAGSILTTGEWVARFEERFANYLGVRHALALTSCTGTLHLSLIALGIEPGDEVITTPMTFIATATAIMEAGAKPVFVDVESETGNLNASLIEAAITERTRAILVVHLFGQCAKMEQIDEIAARHGIKVIEDAAQAIGAKRNEKPSCSLSFAGCLSFYPTKNLGAFGDAGAIWS